MQTIVHIYWRDTVDTVCSELPPHECSGEYKLSLLPVNCYRCLCVIGVFIPRIDGPNPW